MELLKRYELEKTNNWRRERMKKFFKTIGMLALWWVLPMAVILGVLFVFGRVPFLGGLQKNTPSIFYGFSDPILIVLYFVIYKLITKQKFGPHVNFSKISVPKFLVCAVLGFVMAMFTFSLITFDYIQKHFGDLVGSIKYFIAGGNIFLLTYVVLVNSVCKEVGFRGAIYNELKPVMPVFLALIIQAMFYASQVIASGAGWNLTTYAFIGAMVFGIIYQLGKSLWTSVIAQVVCTMSLTLFTRTFFGKVFTAQSAPYLLVVSIVLVVVFLMVLNNINKSSNQTQSVAKAG
jgi:membrane protease YdiL (CAAX protease family)